MKRGRPKVTHEQQAPASKDGRAKRPGTIGRWSALFIGACLLLFAQAPLPAQEAERRTYDLGIGTPESASHPLGVTIAALVKLRLLPRANIDINARNTEGSRGNALALRNRDLHFGILSKFDAYHAFHGSGPFIDVGEDESLRHLANLWTSVYHFVLKPEHAATGTLDDFLQLRGQRVFLGEEGSLVRDYARSLLSSLEVDLDDAYGSPDLNGRSAAQAFLDGDLDGFLLVDDSQGADIADFLEEAADRAVLLAVGEKEFTTIQRRQAPVWSRVALPDGTLPEGNGDQDHVTIGMDNLLGVTEDVSEETVDQITRLVFDNLLFLRGMDALASAISLETAVDRLVLPVHLGAARYYSEVGVTLPEPEQISISALTRSPFLTRYGSVDEARARLNENTVTVLGGDAGQTITRMLGELAATVAESGIRVIGMTSSEPAENIADVLYARGVDSAMVPLDVLEYALEQNVYPNLGGKLAYITELFTKEVHLVATDSIEEIDDLIGQRVNLGPRGSATAFTISLLLDRLNIPVEPAYVDHRAALSMLERGELAALFMISGKPMPLLDGVSAESGLRLLPVPSLEGEAYRQAVITPADYPDLLEDGATVETFSVRTVLASYNWRPDNSRYQSLSSFIDVFFDRLTLLQEPNAGHHPKWREIDPLSDLSDWRRSPAAQRWIDGQ